MMIASVELVPMLRSKVTLFRSEPQNKALWICAIETTHFAPCGTYGRGMMVCVNKISEARLFTGPDSARGLGAGLCVDADGHLLGDDPRAAAGLSGDGAGHLDGDGRLHRRHRRSHGVDHQDILGRALCVAPA